MKKAQREGQVQSIRDIQQKLKRYINKKNQDKKARVFTPQEIKDIIFHLQTIAIITDEGKIARKANKLEKFFWKVFIFEINGASTVSKNSGESSRKRARPQSEPEV